MLKDTFQIKRIEDWDELAKELVNELKPGSILTLSGPLGAGKTTFVQALARALGVQGNPRSPTFSLMRSYLFPKGKLIHVDAYRLEKPTDVLSLNLDEEFGESGVMLAIEWPENMAGWLEGRSNRVHLDLSLNKDGSRQVTIKR
jgi:tRNA threonylcarbamoyladenosine biosynthesis protein TsaE